MTGPTEPTHRALLIGVGSYQGDRGFRPLQGPATDVMLLEQVLARPAGLHEVTRLGLSCGGRPRTFSGLAGLGDLVLTCTGGLSRNRRTGLELAAGKSLEEISAGTHMVAEGVRNSRSLLRLAAQKGIEMPITEQMEAVLYEGKPPRDAVEELMRRDLKAEAEL